MVFENGLVLVTSDSKMAESIGVKGEGIDSIGLGTYSKLRYKETKNLAIDGIFDVEPFTGFYYPIYLLMMKEANHPNAAKLFMEYLLTADGFAPWSIPPIQRSPSTKTTILSNFGRM
jgi:iron(III) transport system substrate-binding protein